MNMYALCNSLPAHVVMIASVNQFKHEFEQYFRDSNQKYHFENDIYEYFFFPPHDLIASSTIIHLSIEV